MQTNVMANIQDWYLQGDLREAVNLCMKALEKSGISAERAELVPKCLSVAIQCSNAVALANAKFKAETIAVSEDDMFPDVTSPFLLRFYPKLEMEHTCQ